MKSSAVFSSTRGRVLACFAFLSVFIVAYFDSVAVLFSLWAGLEETVYRYGFLVLACTCYLLYQKRSQFAGLKIEPIPWALLPALLLSITWVIASMVELQTVQLAVLPFLILATTTAFYGIQHLRLAILPVMLLLFAIPVWWPLLPILKDATTLATEVFLRTIGTPVFVEGYFLHLPGGSFVVDDGCAGLKFLLMTVVLGFVATDLFSLPLRHSAILILAGVCLALVANWIRVIAVVLVGNFTEMQHRLVSDHNDLGWVVYGIVVLLPLLFIIDRLSRTVPESIARSQGGNAEPEPAGAGFVSMFALTVAILISGPSISALISNQPYQQRSVLLPDTIGDWKRAAIGAELSESDWRPGYVGASTYNFSRYKGEGVDLELHIVNYASQQRGAELVSIDNSLADDEMWFEIPDFEDRITVNHGDGTHTEVIESIVRSENGSRKLVWYWFEVGKYSTNSGFQAKLYQMLSLLNQRQDGNLVALAVDCSQSCEPLRQSLKQFLSDAYTEIKMAISATD